MRSLAISVTLVVLACGCSRKASDQPRPSPTTTPEQPADGGKSKGPAPHEDEAERHEEAGDRGVLDPWPHMTLLCITPPIWGEEVLMCQSAGSGVNPPI